MDLYLKIPIHNLMEDHRLVEKFIAILLKKADEFVALEAVDSLFIEKALYFLKFYVDLLHHYKEERYLIDFVKEKVILSEDQENINKILIDHKKAREILFSLEKNNNKLVFGEVVDYNEIIKQLRDIAFLYEEHIKFEDKIFFPKIINYFDEDEKVFISKKLYKSDEGEVKSEALKIIEEFENI